ncbi:class A beta-lactamase [Pararhizobium mangrovi]|uniref:Beta-lactamase n=1 Tax=Pararhizobium mangrovi TaxID=2590452 RepID=A0A506U760_9HYPH|nr:class A beta-lactamase [Pararhizobium mangrovi]TPW27727.1 class A beta-lactamase [Pararhizobium mangrovi]
MRPACFVLSRLAPVLIVTCSIVSGASAKTRFDALSDAVAQVERQLGARVGVTLSDTGSDLAWSNRSDERFLMNSTVKVAICGAVLARRDAGKLPLSDTLPVRKADLLSYAPVTKTHVGGRMTIANLCLAALDLSDNTAANILTDRLGGPQAVTRFFRSIGDGVSRSDRHEPELNTFEPGDPRDTTTPSAMAQTLRKLLLGNALSPASRDQLAEWMSHGGVTGDLLRADAPKDWRIYDKSGSGDHNRNIFAVVVPKGRAPWIVTIFISDTDAGFETRNDALKTIGTAAMEVIRE